MAALSAIHVSYVALLLPVVGVKVVVVYLEMRMAQPTELVLIGFSLPIATVHSPASQMQLSVSRQVVITAVVGVGTSVRRRMVLVCMLRRIPHLFLHHPLCGPLRELALRQIFGMLVNAVNSLAQTALRVLHGDIRLMNRRIPMNILAVGVKQLVSAHLALPVVPTKLHAYLMLGTIG